MRRILETVAKMLRKPIAKCEVYDANVCVFTCDANHSWQPVAVSGYPFSSEVSFKRSGRNVVLSSNPEYIRIEVKGKRAGPAFSINRANKIVFMKKVDLPIGRKLGWRIFLASDTIDSKEIDTALGQPELWDAAKLLLESSAASLHFSQDAAVLYFKPSDASAVVKAIDTLTSLVGPMKTRAVQTGIDSLPKRLRTLVPLMKRWAESDDADRARLLQQASRGSLEKLVKSVGPHLAEIDHYLNSFGEGTMPETATALATLAECALEARLLLTSKAKTRFTTRT